MSSKKALEPRIQDLKERELENIPCQTPEDRAQLEEQNFPDFIRAYVGYASRFVVPRKRRCLCFKPFLESARFQEHRSSILEVEREIEEGRDLRPRLSKLLNTQGYSASGRWSDKDFALNAFGLHHLHLRKTAKGGMSQELVFVDFRRDTAILVYLGNHSSFGKDDLENAAVLYRGATGEGVLEGIKAPPNGDGFTADERRRLARSGLVVTTTNQHGQVVISSDITNSGESNKQALHCNLVLRKLHHFEDRLDKAEFVQELFEKYRLKPPLEPKFSWHFEYTSLVLCEEETGTAFPIVESPLGLSDALLARSAPRKTE